MDSALVIGTHDTEGAEQCHVADLLRAAGTAVTSVEMSISRMASTADVTPYDPVGPLPGDLLARNLYRR